MYRISKNVILSNLTWKLPWVKPTFKIVKAANNLTKLVEVGKHFTKLVKFANNFTKFVEFVNIFAKFVEDVTKKIREQPYEVRGTRKKLL